MSQRNFGVAIHWQQAIKEFFPKNNIFKSYFSNSDTFKFIYQIMID